jgi:hypothetical protein
VQCRYDIRFSIAYRNVGVAVLMNMFANMSVSFLLPFVTLQGTHGDSAWFKQTTFTVLSWRPDGAAAISHKIISELLWWVYRSVRVNQMPQDSTDGVLYRIFPRPSSGSSLWPLSPLSFGTTGRPKTKYPCIFWLKIRKNHTINWTWSAWCA